MQNSSAAAAVAQARGDLEDLQKGAGVTGKKLKKETKKQRHQIRHLEAALEQMKAEATHYQAHAQKVTFAVPFVGDAYAQRLFFLSLLMLSVIHALNALLPV